MRFQGIFKMLASGGFVTLGLARSTGDSYSRWMLLGLVLSAAGDAFLLSDAPRAFLAGLSAFLLAHLAYAAAFAPISHPSLPVLAGVAHSFWPLYGLPLTVAALYCLYL
ncbi:MAG: lysoplasmalogenase family protein, partial [Deltaproteobacteria bacterium]